MAELERFSVHDDLQQIGDSLLENGAVIVEAVLDDEQLARLNTEVNDAVAAADPTIKHLNPALDAFFGQQTRHVSGLAARSMTFANEVMCHPLYLGLCDRVLLPNCADYRLNLGQIGRAHV